jgi:hypothetical protein
MNFTYDINEKNELKIYSGGMTIVNQPISPITGEPFASYDEAKGWAEAHILERISWMTAPIGE